MKTLSQMPQPCDNESPTHYADRVGQWYVTSSSKEHRKQWGQYLTPVAVATFMAEICHPPAHTSLRILDPGAGAGVLSCALCESLIKGEKPKEIDLEAYELDAGLSDCLTTCLAYLTQWLQGRGIALRFKVRTDDFILSHAEALDNSPRLFPTKETEGFDIVISNPPYFKIQRADPRAKAAATVVHGQPNIYALFMAISAALIRPGGVLMAITPRSFAAGQYFRLFRTRFFSTMRPEAIHLFGSRRDAFWRDEILQENVILAARRYDNWSLQPNGEMVTISSSAGIDDLSDRNKRTAALSQVLDFTSRDRVLRIPITDEDDKTLCIVHSWPGNLHAYGLEISTGPVVPFRATSLLCRSGLVPQTHAPLLWMQNVTAMQFDWPVEAKGKAQYINVNASSRPLLVAEKNYVLLRRFSAKEQQRRLTAAPLLKGWLDSPVIGIENHLNYIYRPTGSLTPEETYGLAVLFNSRLIDTYFRIYNGNTQVSATELRAMPLPPLEAIVDIGRRAITLHNPAEMIDILVEEALHIDSNTIVT